MKNLLLFVFCLIPAIIYSEVPENEFLRKTPIFHETPEMIFTRCVKIDRSLSSIKYHLLFDDLNDVIIDKMSSEIDYIWYQLGLKPLPNPV